MKLTSKYLLILFILIFYACCLLFHEQVELPFEWFVKNYGNKRLSDILNVFFALFALSGLWLSYKKLNQHRDRKTMLLYWGIVMSLAYVGYYILMPYKSEGIHFFQYGIFGYLFYLLFKDAWIAFNFSFLFGILDETYQYAFGGSAYLDFNDFLLNFLGSAIGVLAYATYEKGEVINVKNHNSVKGWYVYAAILLFVLIVGVGYFTNVICFFNDDGCPFSLVKWERGRLSNEVWTETNWGKFWHRVKMWEGLILTAILPLGVYFLFTIKVSNPKDE